MVDIFGMLKSEGEKRDCTERQMLGVMLHTLYANMVSDTARAATAGSAANESTFIAEVMNRMEVAGRQGQTPVSMLDALDVSMIPQLIADQLNAGLRRKAGEVNEGLDRTVRAKEGLRHVIRQLINDAENEGIRSSIGVEEMIKQQGWGPRPGKFDEFYQMIAKAKAEGVKAVMIHHPQVLGDTHEELCTNLDKLAAMGLALVIVPPNERKGQS